MKFLTQHRWFLLALLFLGINGFAILRPRQSAERPKIEMTAGRQVTAGSAEPLRWHFTDAQDPAAERIEIEPSVAGEFQWESPHELVFLPDQSWPGCERYVATAGDQVFIFQSTPLALMQISQTSYTANSTQLTLDFNAAVWPKHLIPYLKLETPNGTPLTYSIRSGSKSRTSVCVSLTTPPTQQVVARISKGFLPATGTQGLPDDLVETVDLSRVLKVTRISPTCNAFTQNYIDVRFNLPVDAALANELIQVSPALEVHIAARYANTYRIWGKFLPGQNYTLTFKEGLKSNAGGQLETDLVRSVAFPNAKPAIDFASRGPYISPKGNLQIPLRAVNQKKVKATIERVYSNNLVQLAARRDNRYSAYYGAPEQGLTQNVGELELEIDAPRNEIVPQPLDLRPLLGETPGVYHITVRGKNYSKASHFVVVSDLGISARRAPEECLIWAHSLRTLDPIQGGEVILYSVKNQILARGKTDAEGVARIDLSDVEDEPFLVSLQQGDDLTFLPLDSAPVPQKNAIGSRAYLADGYEAYLFSDRGVYRPGETALLKVIIRDETATAPEPFPVQVQLIRPDGKVDREISLMLNELGSSECSVPWPTYAATGKYLFKVLVPGNKEPIGQLRVAVEEFVPPQLRAELKTPGGRQNAANSFQIAVSAEHLFGGPAADMPVAGQVDFQPVAFKPAQWEHFIFGDPRRQFETVRTALGRGKLDSDGAATFSVNPSNRWRPPAAIKAIVSASVSETGGRSVTAYGGQVIDVYPFYLGLRRTAETFEIAAVAPDGAVEKSASKLEVVLERIIWNTVLKKSKGHYVYTSETQAVPFERYELDLQEGRGQTRALPEANGNYRLTVLDSKTGVRASIDFQSAAPSDTWSARSMNAPDAVELEFDQPHYVAGETAKLTLTAPFAGRALFTLESDQLLQHQVLILTNHTAEISIPIAAELGPNVYCSVSVIRAATPEENWGPHRASGRRSLSIQHPDRELTVELETPEKIRPRSTLSIPVRVHNSDGEGVAAELTLAAVDEGICMLSDFITPNPHAFFFAPRLPEVNLFDLYAQLLPETPDAIGGTASAPGGGLLAALRKRLNPISARRFKPLALWKTSIVTSSNGTATVEFEVPEFTGELRIMAVAIDRARHGSAEKHIVVKRPLVVRPSLPRFVAPNDQWTLPARVYNESKHDQAVELNISCAAQSFECSLFLKAGSATNLTFDCVAPETVGVMNCQIRATMGAEHFDETIELAVRPPAARQVIAQCGVVAPGESAHFEIPFDWVPSTESAALQLSGLPLVKLGASLDDLLVYPHGCLEQTTSKAFPLLYLADLAPGVNATNEVNVGIQQVLSMQLRNGGFSLWPHDSEYSWGSIYATHFLTEAQSAGYDVPKARLDEALRRLESLLQEKRGSLDNQAYACFVLANAGRPAHGDVARLLGRKDQLKRDANILCAAALMAAGNRRQAVEHIEQIGANPMIQSEREISDSLRSPVRDDALLLSVLLDVDTAHPWIPLLVKRLEASQTEGRWRSTQENAVALMALGKYCQSLPADAALLAGSVNGEPVADLEHFHTPLTAKNVEVTNSGSGPMFFYWKSEGVPADGEVEEMDRGITARRTLFTLQGDPVLKGAALQQGRLYVVRISMRSSDFVDNLAVEDLLPAGLEIENQRLKTTQSASWTRGKQTLPVRYSDARDDRMLLFTSAFNGKKNFHYTVRAVTEGEFVWPALSAVCMYDPAIKSVHGAQRIKVTK